jgi:uncharacterized protein
VGKVLAADGGTRTSLHLVDDWPGYFPNGPEVVKLLISPGADPSAPATVRDSENSETPLHWAASSDDVSVAVAPIDGDADIETPADPSPAARRSPTAAAPAWLTGSIAGAFARP